MGDNNSNNDAFMRNQNAAVQARTKAQNRSNVLQLKLVPLQPSLTPSSLTIVFFFSFLNLNFGFST